MKTTWLSLYMSRAQRISLRCTASLESWGPYSTKVDFRCIARRSNGRTSQIGQSYEQLVFRDTHLICIFDAALELLGYLHRLFACSVASTHGFHATTPREDSTRATEYFPHKTDDQSCMNR